jgi:hypothetical protein
MWGILRYVDAETDDDPSAPGDVADPSDLGDLSGTSGLSGPDDHGEFAEPDGPGELDPR